MQRQQHMSQYEELNQMEEGDKVLNKFKEIKKGVEEAISMEESFSNAESSESPSEDARDWEFQLAEKDASLDKLKKMIANFKASEADAMALLSDCIKRIQELESELHNRKSSEGNLFDSLVMQTKQLGHNKILLEESKLEIASLREKIATLEGSASTSHESQDDLQVSESSVQLTKSEQLAANEKLTPAKAKAMLEEMNLLRNELKLAIVAEENSKKAMDDLALALKEVATEANQAKEQLTVSNLELENAKVEANQLSVSLKRTEDRYKELLEETRNEADQYKKTVERLRFEAEESLLAWNEKEKEFVNCIRRAEEERSAAQEEVTRLLEEVRLAENGTVSKEENQKLRDILKQALNEANVAKEAAAIARAENSRLQDTLAGKEEALNTLARENEMLKIDGAKAFENITELKRLPPGSSVKELKNEDKEFNKEDREGGKKAKEYKEQSHGRSFSFSLKDMIIPHKQHKEDDTSAYREADETLKGSIFDEDVCTPDGSFHNDGDLFGNSLDFDHSDDEMGNNRKRRALLSRFGDLIRRGYHRKEQSISLE